MTVPEFVKICKEDTKRKFRDWPNSVNGDCAGCCRDARLIDGLCADCHDANHAAAMSDKLNRIELALPKLLECIERERRNAIAAERKRFTDIISAMIGEIYASNE